MANEWLNIEIPEIADTLEKQIQTTFHVDSKEGLNITGRKAVYSVLDNILGVLFPGSFSSMSIEQGDLNYYINSQIRLICHELAKRVDETLSFHCKNHETIACDSCSCENRSFEVSRKLIRELPQIRETLMADVKSAYEGDPASQSYHEIILSYPYLEAIATQRIAHLLYQMDIPVLPRIMTERAHSRTGIDIHPGATIGPGFFIDHGTGVVIGETCTIGKNVTIYHGVTLGAFSPFDREGNQYKGQKRHPNIEDNCIIYSGAVILGGNTTIGKGSVVNGNALITKSIAPNSVVYNKFETIVKESK